MSCIRDELTQLCSSAADHFRWVVTILRLFVVDEAIRAEQLLFFALDIALIISAGKYFSITNELLLKRLLDIYLSH